jgi:hypothetical protein
MRTEEETKFDLDEKIFNLYDKGLSLEAIANSLGTSPDYILSLLASAPIDSA